MQAFKEFQQGCTIFDVVLELYLSLNMLPKLISDNSITDLNALTTTGQKFTYDPDFVYNEKMSDEITKKNYKFRTGDFTLSKSYLGIVLNLDAGNIKSYSGTGTVWKDLSQYSNNGILVNSPTFDSANSGSIVFDGTNDYVDCGNASNLKFTNNFTINVWVKFNSLLGPQAIISNNENGGYGILANSASSRLETFYYISGSYKKAGEAMSNYNTSSWFNISVTFNGSNVLFYRNGNLIQSVSATGTVSTTNEPLLIGANPQANGTSFIDFFNGKISKVQAYNKVLTATEILQNYYATKARYGL